MLSPANDGSAQTGIIESDINDCAQTSTMNGMFILRNSPRHSCRHLQHIYIVYIYIYTRLSRNSVISEMTAIIDNSRY